MNKVLFLNFKKIIIVIIIIIIIIAIFCHQIKRLHTTMLTT